MPILPVIIRRQFQISLWMLCLAAAPSSLMAQTIASAKPAQQVVIIDIATMSTTR